MPANAWTVGAIYIPGFNGVKWSQPGGIGTPVFPQAVTGGFDLLSTRPFNELTSQYIGVCGHPFNSCMVFRDIDVNTGQSVALLCCPSCTTVQRTISPYQDALSNGLQNAILYP